MCKTSLLLLMALLVAISGCVEEGPMSVSTEENPESLSKAGAQQFFLGQGWDVFTEPLNRGRVIASNTQTRLSVTVILAGAAPGTSYTVTLAVHVSSCPAILPNFGQLTPLQCRAFTRPGEVGASTRTIIVYSNLGTMTTNSSGAGSLRTNIEGIAPGTYDIQFSLTHAGQNQVRFQSLYRTSQWPV